MKKFLTQRQHISRGRHTADEIGDKSFSTIGSSHHTAYNQTFSISHTCIDELYCLN